MPVYIVGYAKRMLYSEQANGFFGSEIPKHNAFDCIDEKFENLNSISNIFQETHDLLVLKDSVIICI